jgi:Tfp pilus assembly protein PilW
VELIVSLALGLLLMTLSMNFFCVALRSLSSSNAQANINSQGGYSLALIQSRVRLATLISNDVSGNILTLGFDDNPLVDSNGDGIPYNDQDHFERFKILNIGTTNAITNALFYYSDTTLTNYRVLISAGITNLPGWQAFTVTNKATVLIRLSIVDQYAGDYYQCLDLQGAAVSLNRQASTNVVAILPY